MILQVWTEFDSNVKDDLLALNTKGKDSFL